MKTPLTRIQRSQSMLAKAQDEHLQKRIAEMRKRRAETPNHPLTRLSHHVSGAIQRGEAVAIVEIPAKGDK